MSFELIERGKHFNRLYDKETKKYQVQIQPNANFKDTSGEFRPYNNIIEQQQWYSDLDAGVINGNDFNIYLGDSTDGKHLISIEGLNKEWWINFKLLNARRVNKEVNENRCAWRDIYGSIDFENTILNGKVKEFITLKSSDVIITDYIFTIKSYNVQWQINPTSGNVDFFYNDNIVFSMLKPTVKDSAAEAGIQDIMSYSIGDIITVNGNDYNSIKLSTTQPEWFTNPARIFPIIIDPTIAVSTAFFSFSRENSSATLNDDDYSNFSYVGQGAVADGVNYIGYYKFDLSSIPTNAAITEALFSPYTDRIDASNSYDLNNTNFYFVVPNSLPLGTDDYATFYDRVTNPSMLTMYQSLLAPFNNDKNNGFASVISFSADIINNNLDAFLNNGFAIMADDFVSGSNSRSYWQIKWESSSYFHITYTVPGSPTIEFKQASKFITSTNSQNNQIDIIIDPAGQDFGGINIENGDGSRVESIAKSDLSYNTTTGTYTYSGYLLKPFPNAVDQTIPIKVELWGGNNTDILVVITGTITMPAFVYPFLNAWNLRFSNSTEPLSYKIRLNLYYAFTDSTITHFQKYIKLSSDTSYIADGAPIAITLADPPKDFTVEFDTYQNSSSYCGQYIDVKIVPIMTINGVQYEHQVSSSLEHIIAPVNAKDEPTPTIAINQIPGSLAGTSAIKVVWQGKKLGVTGLQLYYYFALTAPYSTGNLIENYILLQGIDGEMSYTFDNLPPGTAHDLAFYAYTEVTGIEYTGYLIHYIPTTNATSLNHPENIALNIVNNKIIANWDTVLGATWYGIQKIVDHLETDKMQFVNSTQINFDIPIGAQYFSFKVFALAGLNLTHYEDPLLQYYTIYPPSISDLILSPEIELPEIIIGASDLQAIPDSTNFNQLNISFTASPSLISHYNLYIKKSYQNEYAAPIELTITTYNYSGLEGELYDIKLETVGLRGAVEALNLSNVKLVQPEAPPKPEFTDTNIKIKNNAIYITLPPYNGLGDKILIYRKLKSELDFSQIAEVDITMTQYVDKDLKNGEIYNYRLQYKKL